MKSRLVVVLLLSLPIFQTFAQKIDLDRLNFKVSYRKLAEKPLGSLYRTYKVMIGSPQSESYPDKSEQFRIAGFKMDNATPSFTIKIRFGDLFFDKTNVIERVDIRKDKDGKETGRTYYYKMEVKYNMTAEYQSATKEGNSFSSEKTIIAKVFNSQEYSSNADAYNYWNNNKASLKNKFYEDVINEYVQGVNAKMNDLIGYPEKTESRILWTTDSPKHAENDSYKDACNKMAQRLGQISAQQSVADVQKDLAPVITYFEGIKDKYKEDEKPQRKLRYGAYFNLAVMYVFIDQPQKTIEMADLLIANDYDKIDGRILKEEAQKLITQFSVNKFSTTHFTDDFLDTVK